MAKKKNYFGNSIQPSCSYCLYGNRSKETRCSVKSRVLWKLIILVKSGYTILSSAFPKSSLKYPIRKTISSDKKYAFALDKAEAFVLRRTQWTDLKGAF